MKILITGATGFIGKVLTEYLLREGHQLILATRTLPKEQSIGSVKLNFVTWNPDSDSEIVSEVSGCDAVINLAGESIASGRWTDEKKAKLLQSRINTTKMIVRSIGQAANKPKILINASGVGCYGSRGQEELSDESTSGQGTLAEICRVWEAHAIKAEDYGVRVIRLRIGMVLGKKGGALDKIVPPFKFFAGGWLGNGNQWMSWIHVEDVARLISFCLENKNINGAVNAVSPAPVTNKVFSMVLAQVLKRPCFFPVPEFALKLLVGEMAEELLLASQRALPKKAASLGFTFQFPDIRKALESVLK